MVKNTITILKKNNRFFENDYLRLLTITFDNYVFLKLDIQTKQFTNNNTLTHKLGHSNRKTSYHLFPANADTNCMYLGILRMLPILIVCHRVFYECCRY